MARGLTLPLPSGYLTVVSRGQDVVTPLFVLRSSFHRVVVSPSRDEGAGVRASSMMVEVVAVSSWYRVAVELQETMGRSLVTRGMETAS